MEALATRGHGCRVVARLPAFGEREEREYLEQLAGRGIGARAECGVVAFERAGVEVRMVANANPRSYFAAEAEAFRPDAILASTDDPAQLLLEAALRVEGARVVYLARTTLAVPFGPDCAFPSEARTARMRAAAAVVGVSQYVADYVRRHSGIEAVHLPISPLDEGPWPDLGNPANEFVTMVNPCAVKGIDIFLALADAFPEVAFAAVPTVGHHRARPGGAGGAGQYRPARSGRPDRCAAGAHARAAGAFAVGGGAVAHGGGSHAARRAGDGQPGGRHSGS